jgi:transposase-like protein
VIEMGLLEITKSLGTEEECEKYLERMRWPNGVVCPRCGAERISKIKTVKKFECSRCKYQFSVTAGTIFHKTYIPLTKWFVALYLICSTKKMTINQISRDLELPYKTTWYMCGKIKKAMKNKDFSKLCGIVEVEKTPRRR